MMMMMNKKKCCYYCCCCYYYYYYYYYYLSRNYFSMCDERVDLWACTQVAVVTGRSLSLDKREA